MEKKELKTNKTEISNKQNLLLKSKYIHNKIYFNLLIIYLVVILGNYSVGKSNIVRRIFNKNFEENSLTTIGIEFATLEISDNENTSLYIQVWDTCKFINNFFILLLTKIIAGAEKYKAITTGHIRNADGILLVFDMTNESSIIIWNKSFDSYFIHFYFIF